MVRNFTVLMGMLVTLAFVGAQDPSTKKTCCAIANFKDGSMLRVSILESHLRVITDYGTLIVPMVDVQRIEFGLHCPEELKREIVENIKRLDDENPKQRDQASKYLLEVGQFSYNLVKESIKDSQAERSQGAIRIVKQLEEKLPKEILQAKPYDLIFTNEFPIKGRVASSHVKARSQYVGDIKLDFAGISILYGSTEDKEKEVKLLAEKHYDADQWTETDIIIKPNNQLIITAEGQVDIYPQSPGQYLVSPKGHTTRGKGVDVGAGALLGRIGNEGKTFFVGERYNSVPLEQGRLFLHIVPSPWNNTSMGGFQVRISTSFKIGR